MGENSAWGAKMMKIQRKMLIFSKILIFQPLRSGTCRDRSRTVTCVLDTFGRYIKIVLFRVLISFIIFEKKCLAFVEIEQNNYKEMGENSTWGAKIMKIH